MKKLLYLMGIVAFICNLNAQNTIDPPKLKDYTDIDVFDRNFNQTNFIKGWNWGSPASAALQTGLLILYGKSLVWETGKSRAIYFTNLNMNQNNLNSGFTATVEF